MANETAGTKVSTLSLGVTVVLLYVIFVLLVTFGFGSYIYRTTWLTEPPVVLVDEDAGEIAPDTDIDNNIFLLRREEILLEERLRLVTSVRDQNAIISANQPEVSVSYGPIARAEEAIRVHANLVIADLSEFSFLLTDGYRTAYDRILNGDDREETTDEKPITPQTQLIELMNFIEPALDKSGADAQTLLDLENVLAPARLGLEERLEALTAANLESHRVQEPTKAAKRRILALEKEIENNEASITALREALPLDSVMRARLSSLSLNIWFAPNILLRLVSFPTIFLTLIVTIAAGALGTVVAFSRRYYSGQDEGLNLSRLFVNVGEGIAAAIAIFLFSGAGMLALTQGGGGMNNVELSPYTVAFIAFLSGFMAEDAFAAIQMAGKRIFNTEEDDPERKLVEAKAVLAKDKEDRAAARAAEAAAITGEETVTPAP